MPEQKPTPGRIVYFKNSDKKVFPAIITVVHDNGLLSLTVFQQYSTRQIVGVKHGEEPNQWDWMPFQKDQQKQVQVLEEQNKILTEELEKEKNKITITGTPDMSKIDTIVVDTDQNMNVTTTLLNDKSEDKTPELTKAQKKALKEAKKNESSANVGADKLGNK